MKWLSSAVNRNVCYVLIIISLFKLPPSTAFYIWTLRKQSTKCLSHYRQCYFCNYFLKWYNYLWKNSCCILWTHHLFVILAHLNLYGPSLFLVFLLPYLTILQKLFNSFIKVNNTIHSGRMCSYIELYSKCYPGEKISSN